MAEVVNIIVGNGNVVLVPVIVVRGSVVTVDGGGSRQDPLLETDTETEERVGERAASELETEAAEAAEAVGIETGAGTGTARVTGGEEATVGADAEAEAVAGADVGVGVEREADDGAMGVGFTIPSDFEGDGGCGLRTFSVVVGNELLGLSTCGMG